MKRSRDFALQQVGGQDFLVPLGPKVLDLNALIALNPTGRHIWELLAEERTLDFLVAEVVTRFDVEPVRARLDVQAFVEDLGRLGLLET